MEVKSFSRGSWFASVAETNGLADEQPYAPRRDEEDDGDGRA
ncbi:hypothetical protein [Cellulomonas bogoriensis]|nr:hypothetical protein [Cellulomonas bogoriensis]